VATTRTPNALMCKPGTSDRNWDLPLNANTDFLDGMSSIGRLLVTPSELPSESFSVRVTPGPYVKADGSVNTFAGIDGYGLLASSTTTLWLTDAGILSASDAFPTTPHVRLATVVTGPTCVQSVIDERVGARTCCATTVIAVDPASLSIGFFGAPPATQAPALPPLVDLSTGVAAGSVVDAGSTYTHTAIVNNFATLTASVNSLIAAMKRHGLMAS
jgi:hypothetical protein